jgi:hypothetical protein
MKDRYQGQLKADGEPVNARCDLSFALFDAARDGAQAGPLNEFTGVELSDGRFTVNLDFGAGAFGGDARWLEIAVQCAGDSGHSDLGRQALYALDADRVDGQDSSAFANASHDHLGQTWRAHTRSN